LDIKSRFKQAIQNLTSQKNQKQNAIHIQVDFWIQTTVLFQLPSLTPSASMQKQT
jgi:hypothetical protein